MDGPYAGEVELNAQDYTDGDNIGHTIKGLLRGMPYHFRVSAWNGAGESYGKSQYSMPSTMVPRYKPDSPSLVEMSSIDDSTVQIAWDAALVKGGSHQISKFKVQLAEISDGADVQFEDEEESFSVEHLPEVQEIILESSADDMGGHIIVHFMGESSSNIGTDSSVEDIKQALEGISMIDSVDVSIFSHTQDSMTLYGQRWVVTFTSQCGNFPSMLLDTGSAPPSTIATGGTLFGSSSVVRVETISDVALLYEGHTMLSIMANGALCEDTSDVIAQELMRLPLLYEVAACLDPTLVWVMKDVPGLLHFLVSWVTRNL